MASDQTGSEDTLAQPSIEHVFDQHPSNTSIASVTGNFRAGRDISICQNIVHSNNLRNEYNEVFSWLADLASIKVNHLQIHSETFAKVTGGTCKWVLHSQVFRRWVSSNKGILWGHGIPGAGKTVLTSFVIEHLKEQVKPVGGTIAFVYCRYDMNLSVSNILAALILQLALSTEKVVHHVKDTLHDTWKRTQTRPSGVELEKTLRIAVSDCPSAIFVLDALDELDPEVCDDILRILSSLPRRLFVTSREDSNLRPIPCVGFPIKASNEDLDIFIRQEIDKSSRSKSLLRNRPDDLNSIISSIKKKSGGMFLVPALQVQALKRATSLKILMEAIKELPSSLDDMYQATLDRIMAQTRAESSLALRAIVWLANAKRSMRMDELCTAIAVEADSEYFDKTAVSNADIVISVCCGLIENGKRAPRLIHYTTHQFFKRLSTTPFSNPHMFITNTCIVYVSFLDSVLQRVTARTQQNCESETTSIGNLLQRNPMVHYALTELGNHIYELEKSGYINDKVRWFLSKEGPLLAYPLRYSRTWLPTDDAVDVWDICHFAAFYGLLSILRDHVDPAALQKRSRAGFTVLMYACVGGHIHIVEYLLTLGWIKANINAVYHEFGVGKFTAFILACIHGHHKIVTALVQQNASVDFNAFIWAAEFGRLEVVQILLQNCTIKVDDTDGIMMRTALYKACERGHADIVKLLLKQDGLDINCRCWDGGTALHAAVSGRKTGVIDLLLTDFRINVQARNGSGETALHKAITSLGVQVLEHLLRIPATRQLINEQDKDGRTVLHRACTRPTDNIQAVRVLLQCKDIDVNVKDSLGCTALHLACYYECSAIVEVLLSWSAIRQADHLNARTTGQLKGNLRRPLDAGLTALQIAILCRERAAVALLRKAGAEYTQQSLLASLLISLLNSFTAYVRTYDMDTLIYFSRQSWPLGLYMPALTYEGSISILLIYGFCIFFAITLYSKYNS